MDNHYGVHTRLASPQEQEDPQTRERGCARISTVSCLGSSHGQQGSTHGWFVYEVDHEGPSTGGWEHRAGRTEGF